MNNGTHAHPHQADKPMAPMARAKELGSEAVASAGEQLGRVAEATERKVKKFPFAALGIAFGSGIAVGAVGVMLLRPRPLTLRERLEDGAMGKRLHRLLERLG